MTFGPNLLSMGLRAIALAGKFGIFIALARFLGDIDVGRFGLIVATVTYGSFITGMEFYNYSVRAMAVSSRGQQSSAILNHVFFVTVMQVLFVGCMIILHIFGVTSFELAIITLVLTMVDHWAQEGYRTLVAISKPAFAAVSLFFRQGAWVFVVIACFIVVPETRTLEFVLYVWLAGTGMAAIVAFMVIRREIGFPDFSAVNSAWIRRGLPVALVFLGAAAGLQTINFLDRVFQAQLGSDGALAAYVLFFGMSVALIAALDAGVFSFRFPGIVAAGAQYSRVMLERELKKILWPTVIVAVLFLICGSLFFNFGLEPLGIGNYQEYAHIFYTLILAVIFQACSMIPHFGLYALQCDKAIMFGNFLALGIFLVSLPGLSHYGDVTVALARAGAFLFLALWKGVFFSIYFSKLKKDPQ